jgi:drug/metabolite transporter (DMT)-like permease
LTRAQWLRVLLIGLSGYYAASFLDFLGLQYVTAALERLILYLSPTMVLLMSAAFLHRPIARRDALALALSYGGIGVAFWRDVSLVGPDVPLGALLVFGAAVCYATYLVLSGEVVRQVGALRLTALAMVVASAACALQFLLLRPLQALVQPLPVYGWSLANALLSTVLPVFATMMAVERIGAARVAVASIVGPVATIVLGYLALDEPITGAQLAGAGLVVAGVLVISRPRPVVD